METKFFKKSLARVLLLSIVLNFTGFTAYASGFSDIYSNTPNGEAILYLQEHSIVKGYEDGTFKPEKDVSRAELLKIIIEGSKINLDIEDFTPFSDIDYSDWYAPYVKKAYAAGWINGYTDNTFRPNQTISKVESLKIIGKAQNWQLQTAQSLDIQAIFQDVERDSWYEPYVRYAEKNNYLEEKGPTLSPITPMTRGSISEIIYRTIISADESASQPTTPATPPAPVPPITTPLEPPADTPSTSSNFEYIATDFFENISLDEKLPNTFYKNEVYFIKGEIVGVNANTVTVIIDSKDKSDNNYFTREVTNKHFEIPVSFKNSGDYLIGVLPEGNKDSKAHEININSNLPEISNSDTAPSNLQNTTISYSNDKTSITFKNKPDTIKKISFSQGNETVNYLSRQDIGSLTLYYKDFKNFSEGTINYSTSIAKINSQSPLEISSAFSENSTKSFNAVEHSFVEDKMDEVQATAPDTLSSPQNFTFSGTAKTDIKTEALVIRPDGKVDHLELSSSGQTYQYFTLNILEKGSSFTFSYTPKTEGRYIIEINNKNSNPSINHPLYVGDMIPLIPDYFDLYEYKAYTGNFDLNAERSKLLDLINQSRTSYGLDPVSMSDQLNTLAQEHSDDMKINNYSSHFDLNNNTPDDRRIALGITTPVGENIAKDFSVEHTHFSLMRSASHHENILTSDWQKVGLGISLDQEMLIITEEFSYNPLTSEDFTRLKTELINAINDLRKNKNSSLLTENEALNKSSEQLNSENVNSQTLTAEMLNKALNDNNFNGGAQLVGRTGHPWSQLLISFISEEELILTDQIWKTIGANIQTDKNGKIYTIVIVGN